MDITLLRCFSKTTGTNGEVDGQLQGAQVFEYAIMPLSRESHCDMVWIKDQYVSGYTQFTVPEGGVAECGSAFTFFSKECAYITCMPSRQKGVIIRVANYSDLMSESVLTFDKLVVNAYLCDFLENHIEDVVIDKNAVKIKALAYKMVNVYIEF